MSSLNRLARCRPLRWRKPAHWRQIVLFLGFFALAFNLVLRFGILNVRHGTLLVKKGPDRLAM